jgi:hypothetical protein
VDYAKLLEINSFFTFLQVGKTQDLPSKIWQTFGVALMDQLKNSKDKKKNIGSVNKSSSIVMQ